MSITLNQQELQGALKKIQDSYHEFAKIYTGVLKTRQPVHTVYGGAHLFRSDVTQKLGNRAKKVFLDYAPNPIFFSKKMELKGHQELPTGNQETKSLLANIPKNYSAASFAHKVWSRALKKLEKEAVEDFRIDFEDGFGIRSDEEEDKVAVQAAEELAKGMEEKILPSFIGIRIKSFDYFAERSIRTLDIFLATLLKKSKLPKNFIITFPKIAIVEHVTALVEILEKLEKNHKLKPGSLKIELMIELTQTIMSEEGVAHTWHLVKASQGRCRGLHFGTYDYTASCDVIAHFQAMDNPVCDFAKHIMQNTAAATGLMISDGSTNIFPVPVHPGSDNPAEISENVESFYRAWKIQYANIQHSLRTGFYQGWDLHPAQLPIRYVACYAFYLESFDQIFQRMKNFLAISGQATLSDDVFDDAATGQGLVNYFLKGYNCGAITKADIAALKITPEVLQTRSFAKIIEEYKANQNS
jgi:citrate lyase beta subunit